MFSCLDFLTAKEDGETSPTFDAKDHLNKALGNYMKLTSIEIMSAFVVNMLKTAKQNKVTIKLMSQNKLNTNAKQDQKTYNIEN